MKIATIGVVVANIIFQVHGVDGEGQVVLRRRVWRTKLLALLAGLEPCPIGVEAAPRRIIARAGLARWAMRSG